MSQLQFLQIPSISGESTTLQGEAWQVFYPEEYVSHFLNEAGCLDESIRVALEVLICQGLKEPYRIQLSLKTVPVLAGVLPAEKIIRIVSARASRELFLLEQLAGKNLQAEHGIRYKALKNHLAKIVNISLASSPSTIEQITSRQDLPNFFADETLVQLCEKSCQLEKSLNQQLKKYRASILEKLSNVALEFAANYALIRVHVLKFLAILPSLDHDTKGVEVKLILTESVRRLIADSKLARSKRKTGQQKPLPRLFEWVAQLKLYSFYLLPAAVLTKIVRFNVRLQAKRFIAGETIESATAVLNKLIKTGRDATLDQLGELVLSEQEADHYQAEVLKLIQGFSLYIKPGEVNPAGIKRAHVSIKLSALCADFNPHAPEHTFELAGPRLRKILLAAKQHQVFVHVDAEHYHYRDLSFYLLKRVLLETVDFKGFADVGIVIQAYLRDGAKHFHEVLELAKFRKITMPIRLVKGAYWDAETVEADAHSFDAPQFLNKEETDILFRQLILKTLAQGEFVQLCIASHNSSDHCFAETARKELYPDAPVIEHQCLQVLNVEFHF